MPELRPDGPRDDFAGPEAGPEPPFPIRLSGPVIKGFGRGSRELGIPTANIPPSNLSAYPDLVSGVYFGFVGLKLSPSTTQPADNSKLTLSASASTAGSTSSDSTTDPSPADSQPETPTSGVAIYPAVLSIGYNPFYANTQRSIEIHILHHFRSHNFYHAPLNLLILGFIRPEYDYKSLEALVQDIRVDCEVARRSLEREGYLAWAREGGENEGRKWLTGFDWVEGMAKGEVEEVEARELGKDRGGEKEVGAVEGGADGDGEKAEGKL